MIRVFAVLYASLACVVPVGAHAQSADEIVAFLSTAGGLETVCQHGQGDKAGASEAQSLCIGRLEGLARGMQYNCISISGGAQPTPSLTMGDYRDNGNLVVVYLNSLESNPKNRSAEWAYVAQLALSRSFPCRLLSDQ